MDLDESAQEYWGLSHHDALNTPSNAEADDVIRWATSDDDIVCHLTRSRSRSLEVPDPMLATKEPSAALISRLKARHDLHLPPFRSFLISAPPPHFQLTPPDDTDPFFWKPLNQLTKFYLSQSTFSSRTVIMSPRKTSSSKQAASSSQQAASSSNPAASSSNDEYATMSNQILTQLHKQLKKSHRRKTSAQAPPPESPESGVVKPPTEETAPSAPAEIPDLDPSGEFAWVHEALKIVGKLGTRKVLYEYKLINTTVSRLPAGGGPLSVINVLCHTQPCPTRSEIAGAPTAFSLLAMALQAKVETIAGCYIEVTHAMPLNFNMAQLPMSPMGTPGVTTSATGQTDYFNMTVFAKAVVAVDHHDGGNTPKPSSPHPVVPPSTVGVALLERFIPPRTAQEYFNLFTPDSPSVLVDRLVELKSDGGTLIFVYPTFEGGSSFAKAYLRPLLDPVLRTMVGIHELATHLASEIGKMEILFHLFAYPKMTRKITLLLKSLSKGSQRGLPPTYSMLHCSKQVIQLERPAWTEWWTHQERPRIQEITKQYFKRADRLPPNRDVTAATLVREIFEGVQSRAYEESDPARNGIEVGVYVIRRSG